MATPAYEAQHEWESAHEFEGHHESRDGEFEISPIRRVYPDAAEAAAEHMAHMAAEAESEQEAAEGFLPLIPLLAGKILPLAAKLIPKAAKALPKIANVVQRATPQLTRGVSQLTRALFRNQQTRPLLRTVPTIARRTVTNIVRQAAAGQPVSPQAARKQLMRQAQQVLTNPPQATQALRRSRALDRHAHRMAGSPAPGSAAPASACGCGGVPKAPPPCCPSCGQLVRR
jgi:hypothetical protein